MVMMVYYSKLASTRKLGLVSFSLLVSLTCSQALLAMDVPMEEDTFSNNQTLIRTLKGSPQKFSVRLLQTFNNTSGYYAMDTEIGLKYREPGDARDKAIASLKANIEDRVVQEGIKAVITNYVQALIPESRRLFEKQLGGRISDKFTIDQYHKCLVHMRSPLKKSKNGGCGIPLHGKGFDALAHINGISFTLYEEKGNTLSVSHTLEVKNASEHRHILKKKDGHYSLLVPMDSMGMEVEGLEIDPVPVTSPILAEVVDPDILNNEMITITPMEVERGEIDPVPVTSPILAEVVGPDVLNNETITATPMEMEGGEIEDEDSEANTDAHVTFEHSTFEDAMETLYHAMQIVEPQKSFPQRSWWY
jgi:uncharacterized metal-binding protein